MSRSLRILIELTAPGFIGTVYLLLWLVLDPVFRMQRSWFPTFLLGLMVAYPVAAGPSIAYTLLMEWAFRRGLVQRGWKQVGISAFLGCIAGWAVAKTLMARTLASSHVLSIIDQPSDVLVPIGLMTGLSIGLALRFLPDVRTRPAVAHPS